MASVRVLSLREEINNKINAEIEIIMDPRGRFTFPITTENRRSKSLNEVAALEEMTSLLEQMLKQVQHKLASL